jgi:hypothetical protein
VKQQLIAKRPTLLKKVSQLEDLFAYNVMREERGSGNFLPYARRENFGWPLQMAVFSEISRKIMNLFGRFRLNMVVGNGQVCRPQPM